MHPRQAHPRVDPLLEAERLLRELALDLAIRRPALVRHTNFGYSDMPPSTTIVVPVT